MGDFNRSNDILIAQNWDSANELLCGRVNNS